MTHRRSTIIAVLVLITIGASFRVARHIGWIALPPNVAPVSAIALLAAAYLPKRWGWMAPLGLMIASDFAIGGYDPRIMATVYGSFGLSFGLGLFLRQRRSVARLAVVTVAGSLGFYLLTNAAVWLWGMMYPMTLSGLAAAYLSGLPFLRNTLLGDAGFAVIGFGLVEAVMLYWRRHALLSRVTSHG